MTPEELFKLAKSFTAGALKKGAATDLAGELEDQGWEVFLKTLWPFWFEEDFSEDHRKYWSLFWDVLMSIKHGRPVHPDHWCLMLLLGRGLGKSASTEAGRIMRGAILNGGYGMIISETDGQSQEHLQNARILIEHPESRLTEFYPGMAIAENADEMKGLRLADRAEMFVCKNGYVLKAKGLGAKMRGLRVGTQRPNDICLDDIDDVDDTLVVSLNKLRLITSSILPIQARENVTISFSQNLISEHSVVNQIFTGKSDALSARTVIGPTPAFSYLNIHSEVNHLGKLRHTILPDSIPTWVGLDIARAQKFLNDSGLATFEAEYQNKFDALRSGRVLPEFDERRQIITWGQFEKVYGTRQIPSDWKCQVAVDIGYTEGATPHYSAWSFVATSAMNTRLPKRVFVYRSKTYKGWSIDDQAVDIKKSLYTSSNTGVATVTEKPVSWQISHEKTGEMLTLNQKYQLPFQKIKAYKSEDGVPQWRHLSRPLLSQPNPFKTDTQQADGNWEIGSTELFYIVDDDQEFFPKDDKGMALLREQVLGWEYVAVKVTETGQTLQKPSKVNDDVCDSLKAIFVTFSPSSTALTTTEQMQQAVTALYPEQSIEGIPDDTFRAHMYTAKSIKAAELRERIAAASKVPEPDWTAMG